MKHSKALTQLASALYQKQVKATLHKKRIIVYVHDDFYLRLSAECGELNGEVDAQVIEFKNTQTVLGYPLFRCIPARTGAQPPQFYIAVE